MKLPDAVKNRSLFSNYYLDSLIVEQPQWAQAPNIESDYAAIKARFDAIAPNTERFNEAQTEHEFIQPLLEQLGHVFEVQPSLQTSQGTKRPDYAFFASRDAHNDAQPHINTNQFFKTALAVGDAKKWSLNLDRRAQGSGDPFTNQNPNYQIDFYLREADRDWGILTNGGQWRLYHRQTSYRWDSFYEVDLAALLSENGDLDTFRYFYNLFRRDAFIPDPSGIAFLDRVLTESQQYTVGVSDDLKNRVYDALRLLIGGFLNFHRNRFDETDSPLDEIQTNCLILLYRILFTLYAESRNLLPLDNHDYAMQYSLDHLATDIHEKLDGGITPAPGVSLYWTRLKELFTLINDGWEDHIPQYNGGLFNPQQHPFLESYEIGDDTLAKVIELLTRTEAGERIAYRDLDVRHLGDIYEGLLEYQPKIADQDLVIVSKKGSETVESPSSPDQEVAYREGEVYLLTDKGERKATGSYYTPDYIVRYIVENTLAPLCEGKSVDEILSLKILDPATGSGHFLVGVVDYLAEELITHPDAPYITETTDAETELAYWRRRVVESCVYGVDLNPMAVELAKLALWLHTVAKGEPLSFLDHHIRCGNSLIGAKIENLSHLLPSQIKKKNHSRTRKTLTPEYAMPSYDFTGTVATAIGHYLLIEETESRTADQIHQKEHQLDIAQQMLRFHKGVADLWTSIYFGNAVSRSEYHAALEALSNKKMAELEAMPPYQRARAIAAEKRFFHWEIEFPEVFRDKHGREKDNPGFDAVIGNPPYVSVTNIESDFRSYLLNQFITATGRFDLYITFAEQALGLLQKSGMFGFIQPIKFAIYANGKMLRDLLLEQTQIEQFVDISQCRDVFPDPTTYPCLPIIKKETPSSDHKILVVRVPPEMPELISDINSELVIATRIPQSRFKQTPENVICLRLSDELWHLIKRFDELSFSLSDMFDIEQCIRIGSQARRRELVLDEERYASAPESVRIACRKMLDGENIKQYTIAWEGEWLHYLPDELYNPKSPEILETEKILIKRIAPSLTAVPDTGLNESYFYPLNTIYALIPNKDFNLTLLYVTSLLNSKCLDWYYKLLFEAIAIRGGYIEYREYLKYLPIRRINFTTPADERDRQLEKAQILYQRCLDRGSIDCVLGFVNHHLTADPERSDVVHDLLAFQAEQMIEMNKAKGEEIRGFLHWLKREIRAEIDTLKNKTKIQSYFDLSFEELLGILRSNRRRIGTNPSSRDFQELLEREFTKSLDKLDPLLTRIRQTDALIDQVVYQLYGLTDKEIAVVVR